MFAKIEPSKADEFKKTYGGSQVQAVKSDVKEEKFVFKTIAEAEAAIAKQGEKVRVAKASGVEKSIWQLDVAVLLDYKKQLTALQKSSESQAKQPESKTKAEQIEFKTVVEVEAAVAAQAEKVRELKSSSKDKNVWTPEVNILLALKKELASLTGTAVLTTAAAVPVTLNKSGKNKKKK